jgi:hypothetical protein
MGLFARYARKPSGVDRLEVLSAYDDPKFAEDIVYRLLEEPSECLSALGARV